MAGLVKKFLASASVVAGMSAIFGAPAMAFNLHVTDITGSQTDEETQPITDIDYLIYYSGGGYTYQEQLLPDGSQNPLYIYNINHDSILGGNRFNPSGNIELGASGENGTNEIVTLTTQDSSGKNITIRNIDQRDWDVVQENGLTVSENYINGIVAQLDSEALTDIYDQFWLFNEDVASQVESEANSILSANSDLNDDGNSDDEDTDLAYQQAAISIRNLLEGTQMLDDLIAATLNQVDLTRNMIMGMASDPNISYINEENGQVTVGLAGHDNLATRVDNSPYSLYAGLFNGVQMSEIFAYRYGGQTRYGWSDSAEFSGQVNMEDGYSHNGNYEVTLVEDVPEPSTILGLMAIGGLVAATKRQSKKQG